MALPQRERLKPAFVDAAVFPKMQIRSAAAFRVMAPQPFHVVAYVVIESHEGVIGFVVVCFSILKQFRERKGSRIIISATQPKMGRSTYFNASYMTHTLSS